MEMVFARKIAKLINDAQLDKIQALLEPFSLEQRRSIISKKMKKKKSLLLMAVERSQEKLVKYLIEECGASVRDAGPCICVAASNKSLEIVKLLVQNGSDLNELNPKQFSALYFACIRGDMATVEYLLENGAEVDTAANVERITPLMASLKYPNICRCLLINGADPQRVNTHGKTALMMAIKEEAFHFSMHVLLSYNADIDFTNIYGENAVFLASRIGLTHIVKVLQSHGADTTKSLARCYQIQSCYAALSKSEYETQNYWRMYTQILGLPSTTPLFQMDFPNTKKSCFEPILDIFDSSYQKVFLYLENHFDIYNPYMLQALAGSMWLIDDVKNGVKLFSFFLKILASCSDELFFQTFPLTNNVYVKLNMMLTMGNSCNSLESSGVELLKLYSNHVEGVAARLEKMNNIQRELISVKIDSLFTIIASLIKTILNTTPGNMYVLKETIGKIVSVDLRGSENNTLLHFCVEGGYSMDVCKALVSCKADVNCQNRQRFTPVHLMRGNIHLQQREIIEHFMSHGFVFDAANDEEFCLSCTLKKRRILPQPVRNTSLQCLAASVVSKNLLSYDGEVPRHLEDFISLHS